MIRKFLVVAAIAVSLVACSSTRQASSTALASPAAVQKHAPKVTYRVKFDTSAGPFVVAVMRDEAPHGADRFLKLVNAKYFDGARFFRVVPGFIVQWGLAANPKVTAKWNTPIADDPVVASNVRGTITYAAAGPGSRTAQLFINYANNASALDSQGFAPFGVVVSGMQNVDKVYSGYGENPDQGQLTAQGNKYLAQYFPRLDYIKTARVIK